MDEFSVRVILAAFDDEQAAEKALSNLKAAHKEKQLTVQDTATVQKDDSGKLHIKETADMSGGKGAAVGAVIGGVLGVMAGPGGVVAGGAAGAFVGGLAAKFHDAGIKDDTLRKIGEDLKTGSTAIVVVFDPQWETPVEKILTEAGAQISTSGITQEISDQFLVAAESKQHQTTEYFSTAESVGQAGSLNQIEQFSQNEIKDEVDRQARGEL